MDDKRGDEEEGEQEASAHRHVDNEKESTQDLHDPSCEDKVGVVRGIVLGKVGC